MESSRVTRRAVLTVTAGMAALGSGVLTGTAEAATGTEAAAGLAAAPPVRTVRVFWLKPSDVAFDQRYPDGITRVMKEAQRFYRQELGVTFTLNNPAVEVVNGDHKRAWYETTPNGNDPYWWVVFNMQRELLTKLGLGAPDSRWLCVGEISAEAQGVSGGGGGGGWVILSGHDADGAAGTNGNMNRWYGGMVHELGQPWACPTPRSPTVRRCPRRSTTTRTAISAKTRRTGSATAPTAASCPEPPRGLAWTVADGSRSPPSAADPCGGRTMGLPASRTRLLARFTSSALDNLTDDGHTRWSVCELTSRP